MTTALSRDLAVECAHLCDEKGGIDIKVLEMAEGAEFAFAVVVSAGSERQTFALADEVYHHAKKAKIPYRPVEGEAGWMLVDLFDVVLHVLGAEQREFYQIDRLWKNCKEIRWADEWKAIVAARAGTPVKKPRTSNRKPKSDAPGESAPVTAPAIVEAPVAAAPMPVRPARIPKPMKPMQTVKMKAANTKAPAKKKAAVLPSAPTKAAAKPKAATAKTAAKPTTPAPTKPKRAPRKVPG